MSGSADCCYSTGKHTYVAKDCRCRAIGCPIRLQRWTSNPPPTITRDARPWPKSLNGGVAILFAAQEPVLDFMPYRQDEDFYYLTGWNEPGAALLIQGPADGSSEHPARSYREILFLPTRNRRTELTPA